MVKTGLDHISNSLPRFFKGANVGLLCHPASVNSSLIHASDILPKIKGINLKCFFGPQHGIRGETQANMIEWEGFKDKKTGLPVYSLYGNNRKPTEKMLENIDILICDMMDIGSRYYTYIWTLYLCMEACAKKGIKVVVLDRPNPINGITMEGPVLDEYYASFVGLKPLPIRHGMTIGEIAAYFKGEFIPNADITIIKMSNWRRHQYYDETGLQWVMPSPNIPSVDAALVYPGMCLLEGTTLSEGRGTTKPFELFGAPYMDPDKVSWYLNGLKLPGVYFRPNYFKPTFDKFKDLVCGGAQIHILNRNTFKPFLTGIAVIQASVKLYPKQFKWLKGPYEYEVVKKPIDILLGVKGIRVMLEKGASLNSIETRYANRLEAFKKIRKQYLLY